MKYRRASGSGGRERTPARERRREERSDYEIAVARDLPSCAATLPLQRAVLGSETLPAELLVALARNGGFVGVARTEAGEVVGMACGFLGIYDFHFRHHAHALAIHPAHRSGEVALRLREAQRDHCLDQGIEIMTWLADPLDAGEAAFGMARLGAYAREYHRGRGPDGADDAARDRLYVEWPIGTERAYRRLRGEDLPPSLEAAEGEGIRVLLEADAAGAPLSTGEAGDESHLLARLPAVEPDGESAAAWRAALRAALEGTFARGYAIVEYLRGSDGRAAYLLVPQPRRAAEAGESGQVTE